MVGVLYTPCYAAHSPVSLKERTADVIAQTILSYCVRKPAEKSSCKGCDTHFKKSELDNLVLGVSCINNDASTMHLHNTLKNQLKCAQLWWNTTEWFGRPQSYLKSLVQDGMSRVIEEFDGDFECPLFKFTLQLLFTRIAGSFIKSFGQINLELPRCRCGLYSSFLENFDDFHIEVFINASIIFCHSSALIPIITKSPHLKKIHLRYNTSAYLVKKIKACTKLEIFICENFFGSSIINSDCFYKAFFRMSKQKLLQSYENGNEIKLTFPNFRYINIGRGTVVNEFLVHLQYFCRNLISISCKSCNFVITDLDWMLSNVCVNHNVSYTICDISVTVPCVLKFSKTAIFELVPKIKHVTVYIETIDKCQINDFRVKLLDLLSNLGHFSLSIDFAFAINAPSSDYAVGEVFLPIFSSIGANVTALQLDFIELYTNVVYWKLINCCSKLEMLSLTASNDSDDFRFNSTPNLNPIYSLESLSIHFHSVCTAKRVAVTSLMEQLLLAAPNLKTLELILPSNLTDWIMTISANGMLKNVEKLILKLHLGKCLPDVDFYLPVVEGMSKLRHIILLEVPAVILSHMRKIFRTSQLKVTYGKNPIVANYGIGSAHIK